MQVGFFFDSSVPAEAEMIQRCLEFERRQRTGVNEIGLRHILGTRSGQSIALSAARSFQPLQRFTRADLARATDQDEDSVFSWIRQLGRPEKKYRMRVLAHHDDGTYSLSQQMHEAIVRIAEEMQL